MTSRPRTVSVPKDQVQRLSSLMAVCHFHLRGTGVISGSAYPGGESLALMTPDPGSAPKVRPKSAQAEGGASPPQAGVTEPKASQKPQRGRANNAWIHERVSPSAPLQGFDTVSAGSGDPRRTWPPLRSSLGSPSAATSWLRNSLLIHDSREVFSETCVDSSCRNLL